MKWGLWHSLELKHIRHGWGPPHHPGKPHPYETSGVNTTLFSPGQHGGIDTRGFVLLGARQGGRVGPQPYALCAWGANCARTPTTHTTKNYTENQGAKDIRTVFWVVKGSLEWTKRTQENGECSSPAKVMRITTRKYKTCIFAATKQ